MKRALVLCGGGSLGSYEAGAWKYFREIGLTFDIVTGTSIGAINGAFVAANKYDEVEKLWGQVAINKVMKNGLNFPRDFLQEFNWKADSKKVKQFAHTYFKNKGADIGPFMNWVKEAVPVHEVKNSPIKFGVVTTAFPSLKELDVVMNDVPEEHILDYLHASSACFPVFPVYSFDGKSYIDGGYFNNLPIDFALKLGADEIVAVLLHAVPRVPQHKELMELPMVTTVFPSRDTGSIMDFDQNVIQTNFDLGYLDAAKRFGKYWGYAFTFEKDEKLNELINEFSRRVASDNPTGYFDVLNSLEYMDFKAKTPYDLFIRTLEIPGLWLGLDYMKVYTITDYVKQIAAILKKPNNKKAGLEYAKKSLVSARLPKSEQIPFLYYLYDVNEGRHNDKKIKKIAANNPSIKALIILSSLLKSRNIL